MITSIEKISYRLNLQRRIRFGQPTLLIFLLNKDGLISQPLWIVILKKVIAWDLGKRMTVELVQRTLNKAIKSQDYPEAVILHSDQGSQYTSLEYEEFLKYYGMTHSFSRRGYPYHNASLESWHGHLKREWVYQFKYKNFEEAYQSIFWYIEAFYNSKRIHQSLGYLTPNQFEKVSA